ncbi:hypothetical protein GCM10008969_42810 [Pseudomonas veronii subsp. inensis]
MLAKIANDNAVMLEKCGVLGFFASKLAPTTAGTWHCLQTWRAAPLVGASLLAKIANDNAVMLEKCGALGFSRASSLLHGSGDVGPEVGDEEEPLGFFPVFTVLDQPHQ